MSRLQLHDKEPPFNPLDYKGSLLATLKFYNSEVDDDVKKNWTLEYWKAQGKSVAYFDKINGASFAQLGVLIRIMNRGYQIDDSHQKFIDEEYYNLLKRVKKPKETEVKVDKEVAHADRVAQALHDMCSDIDAEFDQLAEFGVKKFDIKTQLQRSKYLVSISPVILAKYTPKLAELQVALDGSDKQIKEGYSQLSKKTLKLLVEFAKMIVETCQTAEPIKRTRKTKPISISKLVSKIIYLKSFPALQFTSVDPERIVGSRVVYLFNVKVRKLFRYEGEKISVKGSTLTGYDETKSYAKTVRKPEVFFQGINSMSLRQLDKKFEDIVSVKAKVTGRVNGDVIILKTF